MESLTYKIELVVKDKGIGFSAVKAFRSQISRNPNGPIFSVRLEEKHSDRASIIVDANPANYFPSLFQGILESSGQMPTTANQWKIESITLQEQTTQITKDLETKLLSAQKDYQHILKIQEDTVAEKDLALEEVARLKKKETEAPKVNSPLEGMLLYWDTQKPYKLSPLINDELDLAFYRKLVSGEVKNTFLNYFNFLNNETIITPEELETLLSFNPEEKSKELIEAQTKLTEARAELEYLKSIEENKILIPARLKQSIIDSIKSQNHESTILTYESLEKSLGSNTKKKQLIERDQKKYNTLSEQLTILESNLEQLPLIISPSYDDSSISKDKFCLTFPFLTKDLTKGAESDLTNKLLKYFPGQTITIHPENKYLIYSINKDENMDKAVNKLIEEVPLTLRLSGYAKLTPFRLGI